MAFQKGQSGNPKGRAKSEKVWADAIRLAVNRIGTGEDGQARKKLALLADSLVTRAIAGDVAAMKEIGDRLDGKPTQAIEHSGEMTVRHEDRLAEIEQRRDEEQGRLQSLAGSGTTIQ